MERGGLVERGGSNTFRVHLDSMRHFLAIGTGFVVQDGIPHDGDVGFLRHCTKLVQLLSGAPFGPSASLGLELAQIPQIMDGVSVVLRTGGFAARG